MEMPLPRYDAILIPGGGVREGGEVPPWVRARLDRALELAAGEFLVPLSAGTPHRPPPMSPAGYPILESVAAARYLVERGASLERILTERESFDTVGNAYFARTAHVDPAGWRRLLVIDSEFHMLRARFVFEWVFGVEAPPGGYELGFEETPNEGLDGEALQLRRERERLALEEISAVARRITTLRALHRWLFVEHGAYSTGGYERTYRPLAGPVAGTY